MLCLCDNERRRFLGISLSRTEFRAASLLPIAWMASLVAVFEPGLVLPDIQAVDLLDCNKGGLTQLGQWLLAVRIDLAAASRLIRTGRPVATNKLMSAPRIHRDGQFDVRS
jgi:hypothetical protein